MPKILTLAQLREGVQRCLDELAHWLVAKPRIFTLPSPEQQVQFELATRLREQLRSATENPTWDRLYFDASMPAHAISELLSRHPPIYVDTRQLFGVVGSKTRSPTEPDVAVAVQVLRSVGETVEFDDDGAPVRQTWLPRSMRAQGFALEQRVAQLERLSQQCCDGALFVVYSNEAKRRTAVDTRDVASWASWQQPLDDMWWAIRHFRAKAR